MLTFGASDAAFKNLSPESFDIIQGAREENPTTSMIGSGAGLLTGIGAAKGALTGISQVGQTVGQGAIKAGASKGLAKAAQYGAEGALISLPKGATELITGTPEEAAETMLYGTAIGGGFGGVTGILPGFVKGVGKSKKILPHVGDRLKQLEVNQGGKVLGFTKSIRRKMGQNRAEELVEWADKKGLIKVLNTTDDMAAAVSTARKKAGETLGNVVSEIDATGKYFADTQKMFEKLQRIQVPKGQLLAPDRRAYEKALADIRDVVMTPKTGEFKMVKLKKLHDLRKTLDGYTYKEFGEVKPGRDLVKKMRGVVEEAIVEGIDFAEKSVPNQARRWKNAKLEYRNYSDILKPLEDKLAGEYGNQLVRPSDMAGAIIGGTAGGLPGAATGYVGNVLRQEYGAQLAYRSIKAVNNVIKRRDQLIDRSVNKFFEVQQKVPSQLRENLKPAGFGTLARLSGESSPGSTSRTAQLQKVEEALATARTNPAKSAEVLSELTGNLSSASPEMAMHLQQKTLQVAEYLHDKAPKPRAPMNPLTQREWKPAEREIVAFERRVQAALDPYSVLSDLSRGNLQRESVETVKDLYPSFHQKLQDRILDQITQNKKALSLKQRTHLSIIMGTNLDPLLEKKNVQLFQQSFTGEMPQQAPARQGKLRSTEGMQSDVQRVTYK
jgi:hypothetical protein